MKMKVLKFGGTSVGSVENMCNVKHIIDDGCKKVVVLSAMSGTTNQLVALAQDIDAGKPNDGIDKINKLHETYFKTIDELLSDSFLNKDVKNYVSSIFELLVECTYKDFSETIENEILAQGELLSTYIFNSYLKQEGIQCIIITSFRFYAN